MADRDEYLTHYTFENRGSGGTDMKTNRVRIRPFRILSVVLGVAHRGDVLRPAPGGWLPVEYGGEPGWVSARYVEAVE